MPSQKYEDLIFLSNLMENVHSDTIQKMLYYTNPTQKKIWFYSTIVVICDKISDILNLAFYLRYQKR